MSSTFSRLLRLKSKSQYQAESICATDAGKSVDWAARLSEVAQRVSRS
ncbi:hypothetical protein [Kribbella sp. CA-294648]